MRLTAHTDYAMRILLHAALIAQEGQSRLISIAEVAEAQNIARNHAMKVVNVLSNAGLLTTVRGRRGGFRLGRAADTISLGEVVRITEPCLRLAECAKCTLIAYCGLSPMLDRAMVAFLGALDRQTLAQAVATSQLPGRASG